MKNILCFLTMFLLLAMCFSVSAATGDIVYTEGFTTYPGAISNGAGTGTMPSDWTTQYFRIGKNGYATAPLISSGTGGTSTTNKSDIAIYNKIVWNSPFEYAIDVGNGAWRTTTFYNAVIFYYQDSANFYHVDISGGDTGNKPVMKLYKRVAGVDTQLASYTHSIAESPNGRLTITIDALNSISATFKVVATGLTYNLFTGVTDTTFTTGKIGVGYKLLAPIDDGNIATFTNISVKCTDNTKSGTFDVQPNSAQYTLSNNSAFVQANITMPIVGLGSATVIVAAFDADNSLISKDSSFICDKSYLQNGIIPFSKVIDVTNGNVSTVKIFVWDSLQKRLPFCGIVDCIKN